MIRLRILDALISIEGDDEGLLGFIAELWAPFVDDTPGSEASINIGIRKDSSGWVLQVGDGEEHQMFDPWVLVLDLRSMIDDLVVASTPGVVDLHAAMALVGDVVVLFPGDPGAGKTTLVLEGLQSGWSLFCDDLSLLEVATGRVIPLPRPIGIRSGVPVSSFATKWEPPGWLPEPSTPYLLPPAAFPHAAGRDPVAPGQIVFPRYDRIAETAITKLGSAETVARLGRHLDPLTPAALGAIRTMGAGLLGTELTYRTPGEGVAALVGALEHPGR